MYNLIISPVQLDTFVFPSSNTIPVCECFFWCFTLFSHLDWITSSKMEGESKWKVRGEEWLPPLSFWNGEWRGGLDREKGERLKKLGIRQLRCHFDELERILWRHTSTLARHQPTPPSSTKLAESFDFLKGGRWWTGIWARILSPNTCKCKWSNKLSLPFAKTVRISGILKSNNIFLGSLPRKRNLRYPYWNTLVPANNLLLFDWDQGAKKQE